MKRLPFRPGAAGCEAPLGAVAAEPEPLGRVFAERCSSPGPEAFGVYVHVPFCLSRCDYCAFATWEDRLHLMEDYVSACKADLCLRRRDGALTAATSVYFGGGTPSLLSAAQLGSVLEQIPLAPAAEVTLECNPDTVDRTKLAAYRRLGVTRLSFGVQSLSDSVLLSLGRVHRSAATRKALQAAAEAGFDSRYSVDLIAGAAGESLEEFAHTLGQVLSLEPAPGHISVYLLTVEPGTPLSRRPERHPDPDDEADKYLLADAMLTGAGYRWYEISNWARPGHECLHNQLYWTKGQYLGIGCSAHSHSLQPDGSSRRWWNVRTPERYIAAVLSGLDPTQAGENLSPAQGQLERWQLSLRTKEGVPASAFGPLDLQRLEGLLEQGGSGRVVLTQRGRLLANEVALALRVPPSDG